MEGTISSSKNNVQLSLAHVTHRDGKNYLYLAYTYDDVQGHHTITIPQVELPVPIARIPAVMVDDEDKRYLMLDHMPEIHKTEINGVEGYVFHAVEEVYV